MVQWQHALQSFKEDGLFDTLMSTDVRTNCPKECSACQRQHRSFFKKNEPFRFNSYLVDASVLPTAASAHAKHPLTCEKPRRRTFKFWQKKTWCEVADWKKDYLRKNKLNALFGCSVLLLQPKVQAFGEESLQIAHRTCMHAEHGIAVSKDNMDLYEEIFNSTAIKTKSSWEESVRWATRTILNLGLMAGFSELVHASPSHGDGHGDGHGHGDSGHHSLLQGEGHGHDHEAPPEEPGPTAIEVFIRGRPT